jgi:DNA-binding IscR family transcriptional regulator
MYVNTSTRQPARWTGIVHISEAANIGLHAMIVLAGDPSRSFRARELAECLGVSVDHLAKVLLVL